jgi:hypothetical protein
LAQAPELVDLLGAELRDCVLAQRPDRADASAELPDRAVASVEQLDRADASAELQLDRADASAEQPDRADALAEQPDRADALAEQPDRADALAEQPDRAERAWAAPPDRGGVSAEQPEPDVLSSQSTGLRSNASDCLFAPSDQTPMCSRFGREPSCHRAKPIGCDATPIDREPRRSQILEQAAHSEAQAVASRRHKPAGPWRAQHSWAQKLAPNRALPHK